MQKLEPSFLQKDQESKAAAFGSPREAPKFSQVLAMMPITVLAIHVILLVGPIILIILVQS